MEIVNKPHSRITKHVGNDILEIVPLGGGNEVGRSCIMIKFKGKLIMVASADGSSTAASTLLPTISRPCPSST
jgi:predicted metal-dependent RNase